LAGADILASHNYLNVPVWLRELFKRECTRQRDKVPEQPIHCRLTRKISPVLYENFIPGACASAAHKFCIFYYDSRGCFASTVWGERANWVDTIPIPLPLCPICYLPHVCPTPPASKIQVPGIKISYGKGKCERKKGVGGDSEFGKLIRDMLRLVSFPWKMNDNTHRKYYSGYEEKGMREVWVV